MTNLGAGNHSREARGGSARSATGSNKAPMAVFVSESAIGRQRWLHGIRRDGVRRRPADGFRRAGRVASATRRARRKAGLFADPAVAFTTARSMSLNGGSGMRTVAAGTGSFGGVTLINFFGEVFVAQIAVILAGGQSQYRRGRAALEWRRSRVPAMFRRCQSAPRPRRIHRASRFSAANPAGFR